MIGFLPRRLRRVVEKLLNSDERGDAHKDDKDQEVTTQGKGDSDKKDGGKHVSFGEKLAVETKTFEVEDTPHMPWQLVGEPDQRWHWCFAPRTEMGRDLALYFEQREHEQMAFEQDVQQMLEKWQEEIRSGLKHMPSGRGRS